MEARNRDGSAEPRSSQLPFGSSHGLAYLDKDLVYRWSTRTYALALHMEPWQLVGRKHFDLFPDPEQRGALAAACESGEPIQVAVRTEGDCRATPVRERTGAVCGVLLSLDVDADSAPAALPAPRAGARSPELAEVLQTISSLIWLQSSRLHHAACRAALSSFELRVRTLALLYGLLAHADPRGEVDGRTFMERLTNHCQANLLGSGRPEVRVLTRAAAVPLAAGVALPLGVAAAELLANALQHAFPGRRPGTVVVRLSVDGRGRAVLAVTDDGVGAGRARLRPPHAPGLGFLLVRSLARQLGAVFQLRRGRGLRASLRLPVRQGRGLAPGFVPSRPKRASALKSVALETCSSSAAR